jgi:hypothetical protein
MAGKERNRLARLSAIHRRAAIGAVALSVALLGSCQQLFTTSLAKPLARPSLPVPTNMTSAQALSATQSAIDSGNSNAAAALLPGLQSLIDSSSGAEQQALVSAAVDMAVQASGVGDVVTGLLDSVSTGSMPTVDQLNDLVAGLNITPEVVAAIENLPTNPADAGAGISAQDYALGAIVLVLEYANASCGGDLGALPASGDPAWTTDPALVAAQTYISNASTLFTTEGVPSQLADLFTSLGGMIP